MRRLVALVAIAGVLTVPAGVALADDALEQYLEAAASSDYRGRGVLICSWSGLSAGVSYDVIRSSGVSMVSGPDGDLLLGTGMSATRRGTEWRAVEISSASAWRLSDRYVLSSPQTTLRMGRPAYSYTVLEDGEPRVRLIVDQVSAVPLLTEVLDGDGRVYRLAVMVDFEAGDAVNRIAATDPMSQLETMSGTETMAAAASPESLPEQVAGYRRADTYLVSGDTVQAFYTDGLFSFSVFEARRGGTPEAFRDAETWEVGGERYRRIVTPSHAWLQWHAPDRSYLLVGDLPPDHLAEVLAGLPEPGDRSWFVRLWRRLFG
jgi:hypothetical protein